MKDYAHAPQRPSQLDPSEYPAHIESSGGGLGQLLRDTAAVTALLDRLLHHTHILKCGPRSWRTKGPHRLADRRDGEVDLSPVSVVSSWWPGLECRLMASFEVSTEDCTAVQ